MIWKDIKKDKPPENEEILFMTGDKEIHLGELFIDQEFKFYCYAIRDFYYCKQGTPIEVRVLYWLPIQHQLRNMLNVWENINAIKMELIQSWSHV
jgi:hypothetical protein